MLIHSKTDKGVVRSNNQDAFIAGDIAPERPYGLAADGKGAAGKGRHAPQEESHSHGTRLARSDGAVTDNRITVFNLRLLPP